MQGDFAMESVCKFATARKTPEPMQIANFVYESNPSIVDTPFSTTYRIHIVTSGKATVKCGGKEFTVTRGSIFFAFPSIPISVRGSSDFKYMYISYFGIRAAYEMERIGISTQRPDFHGYENIIPIWERSIGADHKITDLSAEGTLLLSLCEIARDTGANPKVDITDETVSAFVKIKEYIDEHLFDEGLSTEKISNFFSYSTKYVSRLFIKYYQIGINEYVTTSRINEACLLMDGTRHSVSEIAKAVGFSDPLYFSKVFKKKIGISPKAYINNNKIT